MTKTCKNCGIEEDIHALSKHACMKFKAEIIDEETGELIPTRKETKEYFKANHTRQDKMSPVDAKVSADEKTSPAEKEPVVSPVLRHSGSDFDLSEKIDEYGVPSGGKVVYVKDIKTFIKKLKEDIDNPSGEVACSVAQIHRIIDKRAGEKLK